MKRHDIYTIICLGLSGIIVALAGAVPAVAQGLDASAQPAILRTVGIDQRIGEQIPLDLVFRDATGATVTLDRYFNEKPVILALVYYDCPMLCTEILNGLTRSLRPLSFDIGKEFDIVTVSFDPRETPGLAMEKKDMYVKSYGRPGAENGWHFLTGDPASIRPLTETLGFRYTYDEESGQFAHASAIMVATPEGIVSHYYFGIEYPTKDLRLSLIEASENKLGNVYDQVMLYCFHYDPETGKYGLVIMNVMRLAGLATVLAMGAFMLIMFRRDRTGKKNAPQRN